MNAITLNEMNAFGINEMNATGRNRYTAHRQTWPRSYEPLLSLSYILSTRKIFTTVRRCFGPFSLLFYLLKRDLTSETLAAPADHHTGNDPFTSTTSSYLITGDVHHHYHYDRGNSDCSSANAGKMQYLEHRLMLKKHSGRFCLRIEANLYFLFRRTLCCVVFLIYSQKQ